MNKEKKDICWYTPHANHYHEYLMDKCRDAGLNIDSVYFKTSLAKYPWKQEVDSVSESLSTSFLGVDWKRVFKSYSNYKRIIVAGWGEPTMILLLTRLSLFGGKFYLYTDTPKNTVRTGIKQKFRRLWLNWIWRKSQGILTTGKPGINYFTEQGVEESKLHNFPFVTNLDFFRPNKDDRTIDTTIFSSGRLDIAHKGYDVALNALAKIKQANYTYNIAGSGPDETMIVDLIKKNGLKDNVNLLGWTEINSLVKHYQSCTIFLHSSNFDPFPNAVLEAMACGCIVVASDAAGSAKDRIEDGKNGFLFESGNANSLLSKLRMAFKLSELELAKMGDEARITAEKWSFQHNISILEKIIRLSS